MNDGALGHWKMDDGVFIGIARPGSSRHRRSGGAQAPGGVRLSRVDTPGHPSPPSLDEQEFP